MKKKLIYILLISLVIASAAVYADKAYADETAVFNTLDKLRKDFPDGKYWTHKVVNANECITPIADYYPDSVTENPCDDSCGVGKYKSNTFGGTADTCYGFANRIFFKIFGSLPDQNEKHDNDKDIKVGDWIRITYPSYGHSGIVYKVDRTKKTFTMVEANRDWKCGISWDSKEYDINIIDYYYRALNYDSITDPKKTGTCGTNVKYDINGSTINFSKANPKQKAKYDTTCTDVFRENPEITAVKIIDEIYIDSASNLFYESTYIKQMDLRNLNVSEAVILYNVFGKNTSLESLDLSGWDTSGVIQMSYLFNQCSSLTSLNLSGWTTSNVSAMDGMFLYCKSLTSLDLSSWNTSNVTNMNQMFYGCGSLTSLNLSGWVTSRVKSMRNMFLNCSSLTSLNIGNWNTSNVTDMNQMFYGCSSLTSLDLSKWDTSSMTDMEAMFAECNSLTSLNLSGWTTSNVSNMDTMFRNCISLTSLDLSSWNTSNVTSMRQMFHGCSSLTSLDLSSWNTSNVTNMSQMFYGCSSLTSLDLSGLDTSKVTDKTKTFSGCSSLVEISLGEKTIGEKAQDNNIFTTLPNYLLTWYYIAEGESASNPLPYKSEKTNGDLFEAYDYSTMAGTWTTDKNKFTEGDLDGDGGVTVDDLIDMVHILLKDQMANPGADLDRDGVVTLKDLKILIDIYLGNSSGGSGGGGGGSW